VQKAAVSEADGSENNLSHFSGVECTRDPFLAAGKVACATIASK
jgi:hypothetical protein